MLIMTVVGFLLDSSFLFRPINLDRKEAALNGKLLLCGSRWKRSLDRLSLRVASKAESWKNSEWLQKGK